MKNGTSLFLLSAVLGVVVCSCERGKKIDAAASQAAADSSALSALKDAYMYGYPLVVMNESMKAMTNVEKPISSGRILAPLNQIVNAQNFPDDKFRDVVRPNCDTYYSSAWVNLKDNPMLLSLPDTRGRYALFPILDAWTNVFASPGKRTTGTAAQQYLLAGPEWKGEAPENTEVLHAPTDLVWIIGRVQVNSALDGRTAVKSLQDKISLEPFNNAAARAVRPVDKDAPLKAPNDIVTGMPAADYFNQLARLMVENPPPAADSAILRRMARVGITPGSGFDTSVLPAAVMDSLSTIPAWAKRLMLTSGLLHAEAVNGWVVNKGLGNYGTNYAFRAGVAYGGLGANLDADAIYPASLTDADGEAYDGSKYKYVLHFDANELPPAKAFWSLTMYDADGFMCANPINRFAIGDRDKLVKNKDGSLDILIQHDKPASTSNWLPAPRGPFNLLMRIYWPDDKILNGQWMPAGVKKVG